MTEYNNQRVMLRGGFSQIVTVKGSENDVLAEGQLLQLDTDGKSFVAYAGTGAKEPKAVLMNGIKIPAAGSIAADAYFKGLFDEKMIEDELPTGYTLDTVPTQDGETASITAVSAEGNTGNATVSTVTAGTGIMEGAYVITCKNATTPASAVWSVIAPDGTVLPDLTSGVAYVGQIKLTITNGTINTAVNDKVTVTVKGLAGNKSIRQALREIGIFCDKATALWQA